MIKVCAFGEIMARFTPDDKDLFCSLPNKINFTFGGAEANFLANLSNFGVKTYFISALPNNSLGNAAIRHLSKFNINSNYTKITNNGRLGLYFVEEGIAQRSSIVTYDRENSSINLLKFEDFNFAEVFEKVGHFHISGITPALSEAAMLSSIESVKLAKKMGLTVSCDLNYRAKLWKYKINGEQVEPKTIMEEILKNVDYLFGNEIDIQSIFDVKYKMESFLDLEGDNKIAYYENILLHTSKIFPNIKIIALSLRDSINASSNYITGVLYKRDTNQFVFSPAIKDDYAKNLVEPINDRIGSGDGFSSGFIFALDKYNSDLQRALDFAVASSILKHTYRGDFNYATIRDIENIMQGDISGRIKR